MDGVPSEYNSQTIIDEAESKFQSEGVQAAQKVYQSALLEWVDDVAMDDGGAIQTDRVKEEIAKLWLAYANLNKRNNLNKSATEVYDQATRCPVSGQIVNIWVDFAGFLKERSRPKMAQKLYLRALVGDERSGPAIANPDDQQTLWDGFLRMMQTLRNKPDLTLKELKDAVGRERGSAAQTTPSTGPVSAAKPISVPSAPLESANLSRIAEEEIARPAKRSRWEKMIVETEILRAASLESSATILVNASKNLPPDIETLWFARDGGSVPSPPEPPLFTASPPKLSDPSGKDLVGGEAALKILRLLTAETHDGKCLGSAVLEVCQACWMMAAIKEEELAKSLDTLSKKIVSDTETMEHDLTARASVAGGALAAVQEANARERVSFQKQVAAQRQQILSSSAWGFRKLLYTQQILLSSIKLPGFDGPTVDGSSIAFQSKVCSILHSAFYLRAKVGEASHAKMLKNQVDALEKMIQSQPAKPAQLDVQPPQFSAPQQQPHFPFQQQPIAQYQNVPDFSVPPPPFQQQQVVQPQMMSHHMGSYQQMVLPQQQLGQHHQQHMQYPGGHQI